MYRNLTFRPDVTNNALQVVNEGVEPRPARPRRDGGTAVPVHAAVLPQASGTVGATPAAAGGHPGERVDVQRQGQRRREHPDHARLRRRDTDDLPEPPALPPGGDPGPGRRSIRCSRTSSSVSSATGPSRCRTGTSSVQRPTGGVVPPTTQITFTGGVAGTLQLSGAGVCGRRTSSSPRPALDSVADGLPADAAALTGIRANKTGLYALEEADLFNILCIPAAAGLAATACRPSMPPPRPTAGSGGRS